MTRDPATASRAARLGTATPDAALSGGCVSPRADALSRSVDAACGLLALEIMDGAMARSGFAICRDMFAPELKQARQGSADPAPSPSRGCHERTGAMLVTMRAVLDRETARLEADGLEGKAAVDQVALIVRTLEKIDQMERLALEDQARAAQASLSAQEREQLRHTVRSLILTAAERLAVERAETETDAPAADNSSGGDTDGEPDRPDVNRPGP